ILNKSLQLAVEAYLQGEKDTIKLIEIIKNSITTMPLAEIDYVSIYAYPTLSEIKTINQTAIAAVAVKFGKTRLIDNVIIEKRK
ncbi:MAG TPA: pantoate--beta-alanine ligase, partial [Bacteroidales bacterium]|nr:pantoate--beta-alanine ligase [Bacteroidales bacterium]